MRIRKLEELNLGNFFFSASGNLDQDKFCFVVVVSQNKKFSII
jgi:hypothetical protein